MQKLRNIEDDNTGYSQAVIHPTTNPAQQGLTSVIFRGTRLGFV